ncbi:MAG: buk [Bacillales bacterium]|jgi:butyrate kinase|nr:buk [Bacillales bacterium]
MDKTFILTINPGSTSTKIGLFKLDKLIWEETIRHSTEELSIFSTILEQLDFRKRAILSSLDNNNFQLNNLIAVCGRGGLLKPISGGTYEVNDAMLVDLKSCKYGAHASNLGAILAFDIASELNIKSFIVDPVVVDELAEVATYSGIPSIKRKSIFHALNQKAVARKYANETNTIYENLNLIVAHLGGGITVGAHKLGKVVDVNNGLDGEGPFSPERAGTIPAGDLVELCFSNDYTKDEIKKMLTGNGGLVAYFNSNNTQVIEDLSTKGNDVALVVLQAMCYQISKSIASCAVPLSGKVDAIILTGGISHSKFITSEIIKHVDWISTVKIYPGEEELESLAQGVIRVLNGVETIKTYS